MPPQQALPGSASRGLPVTAAQGRLLLLDRMYPESDLYLVRVAFAVSGVFDVGAYCRAIDTLVSRHEALRTAFRLEDGDYMQVVLSDVPAAVTVRRGARAADVAALISADAAMPFDLHNAPMLHSVVYALDDGSHRLLLTMHHLACDGWSLRVLLGELAACYAANCADTEPELSPGPLQYAAYAAWEASRTAGELADDIGFWTELMRGAPALLEIPTDRPRPVRLSSAGAAHSFALPGDVVRRVAALAASLRTTQFTVLLAAFTAFMSRICGQQDLVIGIPVAGRSRPDWQHVVGMLANTVAVRTDLSDDPSFRQLVLGTHAWFLQARRHFDAPFTSVVDAVTSDRQLSHDPVVQVMFAYDDGDEIGLALPGATVRRVPVPRNSAKFDFELYVERCGDELMAEFIYRTDLLAPATVRSWVGSFLAMLSCMLDSASQPISAATMLAAPGQASGYGGYGQLIAAPGGLVPDLIGAQAAANPDAIALVSGATRLSYRALIARADMLAAALRRAGVRPETRVAICIGRSADMAVAALAVMRAGGVFVPVDPEQPPARLRYLLADSDARLVLTTAQVAPRLESCDCLIALLSDTHDGLVMAAEGLDRESGAAAEPAARLRPDSAAYLLYTSGSTGTPKAVIVDHCSLVNLATRVRDRFGVSAGDRILQCTSIGFDVSVSDLVFAWVAGAELHIAAEHERMGQGLLSALRDSRITYVSTSPMAMMSIPDPNALLPDLRTVVVGGEPCQPELVRQWWRADRRLVNAYGPSEATVYATTAELIPDAVVPIGSPVPSMVVRVLDRLLQPVPPGVAGEIYLAGLAVGRGYANRPGMTAERFVADPWGPAGTRMYRTGDLGHADADRVLYFHGRTDSQVKVRGFRIELGEVEAVLSEHPDIVAAAATVAGQPGDRRLVAFAVSRSGQLPPVGELRAWLGERLPRYMVPDTVVAADGLPLNRSGKVDRARLPAPPTARPNLGHPSVLPETSTERVLAQLWRRVLKVDTVGRNDNFFDLGGNSIRLLALLAAVRDLPAGAELTVVDLFRFPDVASLAAHLDNSCAEAGPAQARRADGPDRGSRIVTINAARSGLRGRTGPPADSKEAGL